MLLDVAREQQSNNLRDLVIWEIVIFCLRGLQFFSRYEQALMATCRLRAIPIDAKGL